MQTYSVSGRSATGAATNDVLAALWNPSADQAVLVVEISMFRVSATAGNRPILRRTTARGTPGSTVTPDADNAWDDLAAPPSGVLLDLAAFTVQPTVSGSRLWVMGGQSGVTGSEGSGFLWTWEPGIRISPGAGLALGFAGGATHDPADFNFVWEE